MIMDASYDPADDKLRLRASARLDAETYARVKVAGFSWAAKQDLFFAMWSPSREDLLTELAGEIRDEDTSLVDRAEQRADRFEGYQERRAADAASAHKAVAAIADNIPMGQPILVGHHSERHARRDAERIENGMRRACKMWDTSQYWKERAAGALSHAKYLERADVRARRIKTLEAEHRKRERAKADAAKWLRAWTLPDLTLELARKLSNVCWLTVIRETPESRHNWTAYDVLQDDEHRYKACPSWSVAQVQEVAARVYPATIAYCERWIAHLGNRLEYERAMLNEQGATHLLAPKPKKEQAPLLNYRAAAGSLQRENRYNRGQVVTYQQREMTQAAYAKIANDYKGTALSLDKSHRFRIALAVYTGGPRDDSYVAIFITDSKAHAEPQHGEAPAINLADRAPPAPREPRPEPTPDPLAESMQAMRATLKAGVRVAVVPQLIPTPGNLAARMVELAAIEPTHSILEPNSGTGNLLAAIRAAQPEARLVHVEINRALCISTGAINRDFLECDLGQFDRIIMNPPFGDAADIKHIEHAATMLKPGGRLVALCANGPRQQARLQPRATTWEELPPGTFDGTGVRAALLTIDAPRVPAAAPAPVEAIAPTPAPTVEATPQGLQLVIPNAERSARQAAAFREAAGRGRIAPTKPQRPADLGLFASPQPDQLDIEDTKP
jgi:hypothetical protein